MPIPDSGFRCEHCRNLYSTEEEAAACEEHHEQAGQLYWAALQYCVARELPYGTRVTVTVFPADQTVRVKTPSGKSAQHNLEYEVRPAKVPYAHEREVPEEAAKGDTSDE